MVPWKYYSWHSKGKICYIVYLFLTKFTGRNFSYGPTFSPLIYGAGHESTGKKKMHKLECRLRKRGLVFYITGNLLHVYFFGTL